MVRIGSELCDCGRKKRNETGKRKENKQMRTGKNIGVEGAKKVSDSLKINATLTELYLGGDDKIARMK